MDAYIFQADIYCAECGEAIRARLDAQGRAPEHPDDEYSYDSDEYPKGSYADGGGEADCPQHCGSCHTFLENPLTSDGAEYVQQDVMERHTSITQQWAEHYSYLIDQSKDSTR